MNCNCLETVPQTVLEKQRYKGHPIGHCKIKETAFQYGSEGFKRFTCSTLELEVEGRKTPVQVTMAHSYCPFCGTKIELETKPTETATGGEGHKQATT